MLPFICNLTFSLRQLKNKKCFFVGEVLTHQSYHRYIYIIPSDFLQSGNETYN